MPVIQMPDGTSVNMPDNPDPQLLQRLAAFRQSQSAPQPAPSGPNGPQTPYTPKFQAGQYSGPELPPGAGIGPNDAANVWNTEANPYTPQQMQAAQQGVNVDANAGVSTARANFAATKAQRDQIVAQQIKQKYGPNTLVRTGNDAPSGDVEWYNTKADGGRGQWQTAGNSFSGGLVNAIPATGEAIGGTLGSMVGPVVLDTAIGAGVGRAAGQGIKNLVGNRLYPNTPTSDYPSLWKAGLTSGGETLAAGVLTSGVPAAFRMVFKGADVVPTKDAALSIIDSFNKNIGMVNDMNSALAAAGSPHTLQMSVPRVAMIPDKNGIQNAAAMNMADEEPILMAHKSLAGKENARNVGNVHAIEDLWENEINAPYSYQNINQQNWQANLGRIYNNFKDGVLGPAQQDAETAVQKATQAASQQGKPGDLPLAQGGQIVRNAVLQHYQASRAVKDAAWANYETLAKYNPDGVTSAIRVPITPNMMATQRAFGKLSEGALTDSQAAAGARYIIRLDPGVNFGEQTIDLARLDRTIKDMREEGRYAASGTVADGMSDANRGRLLGSLVDMRSQFMDQPENTEISSALSTAEAETVRHASEFQRGFVGDFLTRDNSGNYRISDPSILHTILDSGSKNVPDVDSARQLASLVNGDPAAHSAILDYSHAYYNVNYTKQLADGTRILDPKLHARFNENVMPVLRPFLSPTENAQFGALGKMANAVVSTKNDLVAAQKAWSANDPGRLGARLSNETFISDFFNKDRSFADTNLNFIKRKLNGIGNSNSDALQITRAGILSALNNRIRDNTSPMTRPLMSGQMVGGPIDIDKLASTYQPLRDRFQSYFGSNFTNAIDKILPVLKTLKQQTTGTTQQYNGKTALSHYVRYLILGPLSPENRKLTIMENWRTRSYANRLEQAMYDPSALQDLASQLGKWGSRSNRARIGGAIGIGNSWTMQHSVGASVPQQKQQGQGLSNNYP